MSTAFGDSQICDLGPYGREHVAVGNCTSWFNWLIFRLGPPIFDKLWVVASERLDDRRVAENTIQREWDARTSRGQVYIERKAALKVHKVLMQRAQAVGPVRSPTEGYLAELRRRRAEGRPDNEYDRGPFGGFIIHHFTLLDPPVDLGKEWEKAAAMS